MTQPYEALGITKEEWDLADHIEMEHERELAPGTTFVQMLNMHKDMHFWDSDGSQYGHVHEGALTKVRYV